MSRNRKARNVIGLRHSVVVNLICIPHHFDVRRWTKEMHLAPDAEGGRDFGVRSGTR